MEFSSALIAQATPAPIPAWGQPILQTGMVLLGYAVVGILAFLLLRNPRWREARVAFYRDRVGMVSLGVIAVFLGFGLLESIRVPKIATSGQSLLEWAATTVLGIREESGYSAPLASETLSVSTRQPLKSPGDHVLGTDVLGQDTLLQTLRGAHTALILGALTSAIYIPIGVLLGLLAGYFRGWVDDLIQYVYSVVASVPTILMLVALLSVMDKSLGSMALAIGITAWVSLCRLLRGETLRLRERQFILAARALGQSHINILLRHVLPNVVHLVLISFVLGFSNVVLAEAVLSYVGVGVQIGTASWGQMIDGSRGELSREPVVWWNLVGAGGALFLFVLALNLCADSLRKALDPRAARA
jgi:peptide/nickel transport system permease protein